MTFPNQRSGLSRRFQVARGSIAAFPPRGAVRDQQRFVGSQPTPLFDAALASVPPYAPSHASRPHLSCAPPSVPPHDGNAIPAGGPPNVPVGKGAALMPRSDPRAAARRLPPANASARRALRSGAVLSSYRARPAASFSNYRVSAGGALLQRVELWKARSRLPAVANALRAFLLSRDASLHARTLRPACSATYLRARLPVLSLPLSALPRRACVSPVGRYNSEPGNDSASPSLARRVIRRTL